MQEKGATVRQAPEELREDADSLGKAERQGYKLNGAVDTPKQSERNYEELVDCIDGIVWEADARSFQFCFVSKQAERLLGYPASQWLTEPTFWRDHIHPDDRDKTVAFCLKATKERRSHELEYRMIDVNGQYVWLRDIITVVLEGDQPVKLRGVMVDITERKQAEKELKKYHDHLEELVEERTRQVEVLAEFPKNNPNPVLKCNKKGDIIYVNPAMEHFLKELELDTCQNIRECFTRLYEKIIKIIGTDKTIINQEIELHGKVLLLSSNSFPDEESAFILLHEITERKQAEEALRDSEERFRLLAQTANDAIITVNVSGNITFWNDAAETIFGYPRDEVIGKPLTFIIPKRFQKAHENGMKQLVITGESKIIGEMYEVIGLRKDGSEFPVELSTTYWKTREGLFFTGIVRDITERKQAEKELRKYQEHLEELVDERTMELMSANLALEQEVSDHKRAEEALTESEEKLRVMFESTREGILTSGPDGRIISANPALALILGYKSPRELVAKPAIELYVDPKQREGLFRELMKKGYVDEYELKLMRKDGTQIHVLGSATVHRDREGNILRTESIFRDITGRKRAEEEIRRMSRGIESAGECIVMTDLEGTIQYVNPAFTQLTGYTAEEALGQNPRILRSGRYPTQFYKNMWDTILGGEVWSGEVTNKRKDGTLFDAVLTIAPVFKQMNELEGFVAVQRDITRQKQAEMELRQAKQQAEISDRLKSTFLSIMSHEVRTPLNAMLGFNDLLALELREQLSDEQKGFIETIQKSGDRLKRLMDDILDISQIEADRSALELGSFLGDEVVKKAVTKMVLSAREKNLEVVEEYAAPDLRIRLDGLRFQQAVGNILQNAVKFTHEGGISVSTKTENDEYRVVVKDTGIGIRDKFKPYLFSLFRQAEEGYDRSYEGAGLGLAISQRLVEAMNGRIEVESRVGEGSTFTIIIPAEGKETTALQPEMVDEVGLVVPVPLRPPAPSVGKKIEKATVLILEDNPANLKLNEFLVKKLNLDHISAETGEKALELVKGKPVDCMLVDISLAEGMTGIEFMKKARRRKQFKNVPIIAVTAHSMVGDRERFLKHGFDDYLAKPFTINDLESRLKRNLVLG